MHFWIDKRSSYGIGHNRMAGLTSYHHRNRIRSKSIITPQIAIRPHPIPSTSHHQNAKSHQHRNRHVEPDHRPNTTTSRTEQHSITIPPQVPSIPMHLNSQYVPVIHSVYPREEVSINHLVESTESTRSNGIIYHWLPIQIICVICISLAIAFLVLKLYFDNEVTGLHVLSFGSICIAFLMCTTTISILRMRKTQYTLRQRLQNDIFTGTAVDSLNHNQIIMQSHCDVSTEPPPPYNVAINLPDKQSTLQINKQSLTPPPSYEKINII